MRQPTFDGHILNPNPSVINKNTKDNLPQKGQVVNPPSTPKPPLKK